MRFLRKCLGFSSLQGQWLLFFETQQISCTLVRFNLPTFHNHGNTIDEEEMLMQDAIASIQFLICYDGFIFLNPSVNRF